MSNGSKEPGPNADRAKLEPEKLLLLKKNGCVAPVKTAGDGIEDIQNLVGSSSGQDCCTNFDPFGFRASSP